MFYDDEDTYGRDPWEALVADYGGDRYAMIRHCTEYGISRRDAYWELFGERFDD